MHKCSYCNSENYTKSLIEVSNNGKYVFETAIFCLDCEKMYEMETNGVMLDKDGVEDFNNQLSIYNPDNDIIKRAKFFVENV